MQSTARRALEMGAQVSARRWGVCSVRRSFIGIHGLVCGAQCLFQFDAIVWIDGLPDTRTNRYDHAVVERDGFTDRSATVSRRATSTSTASPAACPWVSLMRLKPSRSITSTANDALSRLARATAHWKRSFSRLRVARPVRLSWLARASSSACLARSCSMTCSSA